MNVLVLGATGLLGNAVYRVGLQSHKYKVYGTYRHNYDRDLFAINARDCMIKVNNLLDLEETKGIITSISPEVIINCLSNNSGAESSYTEILEIHSIFPKKLAHLCFRNNIRLCHISSDGVFSGLKGNYTENDVPDSGDNYGKAKFLGETYDNNLAITLRTSVIGHELFKKNCLLEWFLSQKLECRGYTNSIFSGITTVEFGKILFNKILPNKELFGLYHLGSKPISKYSLLQLIAKKYNKNVIIVQDPTLKLNRSLSVEKLNRDLGYNAPDWDSMLDEMKEFKYGLV